MKKCFNVYFWHIQVENKRKKAEFSTHASIWLWIHAFLIASSWVWFNYMKMLLFERNNTIRHFRCSYAIVMNKHDGGEFHSVFYVGFRSGLFLSGFIVAIEQWWNSRNTLEKQKFTHCFVKLTVLLLSCFILFLFIFV